MQLFTSDVDSFSTFLGTHPSCNEDRCGFIERGCHGKLGMWDIGPCTNAQFGYYYLE